MIEYTGHPLVDVGVATIAAFVGKRDPALRLPNARMYCIFFVDTKGGIPMRTRIQKWGNSLALRIPKALAAEVHIEQDSLVEISLVEGKLILEPVAEPAWTLEELLAGVTEQNLHGEVDTGPATGREAW